MIQSEIISLYERGNYDEVIEIIEERQLSDPTSLILKSLILIRSEEMDSATEILDNLKRADLDLDLPLLYARSYMDLRTGQYQDTLQHLSSFLSNLDTDIQIEKYWLGKLFNLQGIFFALHGEYDNAIISANLALSYFEELVDNQPLLSQVMNNISGFYFEMGDLIRSISTLNETLEINELVGNDMETARVKSNLASLLASKGEIKDSLKMQKEALILKKKVGNQSDIATTLSRIGNLYEQLNDFEEAEKYDLEAYEIRLQTNNEINVAYSEFDLCRLYYNFSKFGEMASYFKKLANHEIELNRIIIRQQIAQALILLSQRRMKSIDQAQKILKKIIGESIPEFTLWMFTVLKYCKTLILEISLVNNEEVFSELNDNLEKLELIAETQKLYSALAETLIIRYKVDFIRLNFEDAFLHLQKATSIVEHHQLTYLKKEIKDIQEEFTNSLFNLNAENFESDLLIRIRQSKIEDYLHEVAKLTGTLGG